MQARTKKEVIGMTKSGETHVLAAFDGTGWSLMNSNWWFKPCNTIADVGHIYELIGSQRVSFPCTSCLYHCWLSDTESSSRKDSFFFSFFFYARNTFSDP